MLPISKDHNQSTSHRKITGISNRLATTKVPDRVLHPQWYNIENNYGSTEQSQDHSA